jgi:murein DD-endopeptidase MepM/ murein hydrolase activator NlpD
MKEWARWPVQARLRRRVYVPLIVTLLVVGVAALGYVIATWPSAVPNISPLAQQPPLYWQGGQRVPVPRTGAIDDDGLDAQVGAEPAVPTLSDPLITHDWFSLPFAWPVPGWISTPFHEAGPYWVGGFHQGIDIACGYGTPVRAAAAGVVVAAANDGWNRGYGDYVQIDHGYDVTTIYGHMEKVVVEAGERVQRGQLIGFAGATGAATGPHVHFEMHVDGYLQDPMQYLPDLPETAIHVTAGNPHAY